MRTLQGALEGRRAHLGRLVAQELGEHGLGALHVARVVVVAVAPAEVTDGLNQRALRGALQCGPAGVDGSQAGVGTALLGLYHLEVGLGRRVLEARDVGHHQHRVRHVVSRGLRAAGDLDGEVVLSLAVGRHHFVRRQGVVEQDAGVDLRERRVFLALHRDIQQPHLHGGQRVVRSRCSVRTAPRPQPPDRRRATPPSCSRQCRTCSSRSP